MSRYRDRDEESNGGGLVVRKWIWIAVPCFIIFLILIINIFTIRAGEVGTRFNPFGEYKVIDYVTGGYVTTSVSPQEYVEGIHIKPPWVRVDRFNTKTQEYTMTKTMGEGQIVQDDRIRTVTNEGLYVDLDITVLYRLNPSMADSVRRSIGRDGEYQGIVVRPNIRSAIREVISSFQAADIYGYGRTAVQARIFDKLSEELEPRGILVESILLRDVGLPEQLTEAIEAKKKAEQEALRMEYVLQKEVLEKERKLIEAEGIAAANQEISGSLTSEYLTWYWIENLYNHDSVVYLIPGDTGLPLFKAVP